ncbi:acyl-CoA dehydrogenase [Sinimarinibacterium sp. CAU 1509]|uniref:acyl-CoA dehydrogenase family protein n=1 Tax=Sinimarinibacterium sp. CAU 1509 TaxID=2562283 RepID=UPI0010ACF753|nr:acyl-CoA dehydrogenase family protein [Sinimarinibacterium sp. CAU 1509]TJY58870.1 acyl-CoA dehydrogenase [Sinimarinibacterium sp. CAU 1509]
MSFAFTEDQVLIRESAENFLGDASRSDAVRAAMETTLGYDESLWQRLAGELGWCATAIAEEYDGLGLGPVELVLIQEQAGRRLLCAPFFSTVCMAATAVQQLGGHVAQARFLPQIAAGELRMSLPMLGTSAQWDAAAAAVHAHPQGDDWVLDGGVALLPDAAGADWFLVCATLSAGGRGLFAVPAAAAGVKLTSRQTWDATRQFADVQLSGVHDAVRIDTADSLADGLPRCAALMRLYLAAEQLGAAQQCLDLTVEYAGGRKQFGRVIAGFQAVKHRCAEMMVKIEALRSAVYGAAALAVSEDGDSAALAMECAAIKALASDTFYSCAQEAIQLHGGVGFTWEYDPQLYFKRAQASSHWFGSADALRGAVADRLLG